MGKPMDDDIQDIHLALMERANKHGRCSISLIDLTKDTAMCIEEIKAGLDYLLGQGVITSHDTNRHSWNSRNDIHRLWCFQLNQRVDASIREDVQWPV